MSKHPLKPSQRRLDKSTCGDKNKSTWLQEYGLKFAGEQPMGTHSWLGFMPTGWNIFSGLSSSHWDAQPRIVIMLETDLTTIDRGVNLCFSVAPVFLFSDFFSLTWLGTRQFWVTLCNFGLFCFFFTLNMFFSFFGLPRAPHFLRTASTDNLHSVKVHLSDDKQQYLTKTIIRCPSWNSLERQVRWKGFLFPVSRPLARSMFASPMMVDNVT